MIVPQIQRKHLVAAARILDCLIGVRRIRGTVCACQIQTEVLIRIDIDKQRILHFYVLARLAAVHGIHVNL